MEFHWPDGRALLDQPVQLVRAFMIAGPILARFKKEGS